MERYLPPDEQHALLNAAHRVNDPLAQRDYHWMSALILSGCRIEEFSLIQVRDVFAALKDNYLFIPKEHRKGGHRDHRVYLTQALRRHLIALVQMDEPAPTRPLVPGRFGAPMTVRQYQLRLKVWAAEAGITGRVSPHWLRHTRAMNIMRGSTAADPRGVVQSTLGHASISSTGVYTQPAREDVEATLDELDSHATRRPSLAALRRGFDRRAR